MVRMPAESAEVRGTRLLSIGFASLDVRGTSKPHRHNNERRKLPDDQSPKRTSHSQGARGRGQRGTGRGSNSRGSRRTRGSISAIQEDVEELSHPEMADEHDNEDWEHAEYLFKAFLLKNKS